MISFDQVLLLEERVESAVKKIEQLNAENAALRAKVAELSNALNAKSEQFSSFQSDQSKIEEGILKALSRLNAVENVVLQASGAAQSFSLPVQEQNQSPSLEQAAAENHQQPAPQAQAEPVTQKTLSEPQLQSENPSPLQRPEPTFDTMTVSEQSSAPNPMPEALPAQNASFGTPTPDVDFEFGESEAPSVQQTEPSEPQNSDSSQPMFDIF